MLGPVSTDNATHGGTSTSSMIASPRESRRFHFEMRRGGWVDLYSLRMLDQSLSRRGVASGRSYVALAPKYTMLRIVVGERSPLATSTYPEVRVVRRCITSSTRHGPTSLVAPANHKNGGIAYQCAVRGAPTDLCYSSCSGGLPFSSLRGP